jgi:hypothetical protein
MENLKLVIEKWTFLESHGIFLKVAWKIMENVAKKPENVAGKKAFKTVAWKIMEIFLTKSGNCQKNHGKWPEKSWKNYFQSVATLDNIFRFIFSKIFSL